MVPYILKRHLSYNPLTTTTYASVHNFRPLYSMGNWNEIQTFSFQDNNLL